MAYYIEVFAPDTYEEFLQTSRDETGVRARYQRAAERLRPGDILVCYLTRVSRWMGLLKVVSERPFQDDPSDDMPYVVRLKVHPIVFLDDIERAIPIRDPEVWTALSFTRDQEPGSRTWTGKFRGAWRRSPMRTEPSSNSSCGGRVSRPPLPTNQR